MIDTRAVLIIPWAIGVWNVIITRTYTRMFWHIVLPLSGPIIAVITLSLVPPPGPAPCAYVPCACGRGGGAAGGRVGGRRPGVCLRRGEGPIAPHRGRGCTGTAAAGAAGLGVVVVVGLTG